MDGIFPGCVAAGLAQGDPVELSCCPADFPDFGVPWTGGFERDALSVVDGSLVGVDGLRRGPVGDFNRVLGAFFFCWNRLPG